MKSTKRRAETMRRVSDRCRSGWHELSMRLMSIGRDDAGMSTVEYAIGTIAAAAFGALLLTVVNSGSVQEALSGIIERALNTGS